MDVIKGRDVTARKTTAAMLAVLSGCRTISQVMERTGLARGAAHLALTGLREAGLIEYGQPRQGAIHPRVAVVACDPSMIRPPVDVPRQEA